MKDAPFRFYLCQILLVICMVMITLPFKILSIRLPEQQSFMRYSPFRARFMSHYHNTN